MTFVYSNLQYPPLFTASGIKFLSLVFKAHSNRVSKVCIPNSAHVFRPSTCPLNFQNMVILRKTCKLLVYRPFVCHPFLKIFLSHLNYNHFAYRINLEINQVLTNNMSPIVLNLYLKLHLLFPMITSCFLT